LPDRPIGGIARIRELLSVPLIPIDGIKAANAKPEQPKTPEHSCPSCGGCIRIIETFLRGQQPNHRSTPLPPKIKVDTASSVLVLRRQPSHLPHNTSGSANDN
jgi:hypothetical protein